jgi:acyl carrier protein
LPLPPYGLCYSWLRRPFARTINGSPAFWGWTLFPGELWRRKSPRAWRDSQKRDLEGNTDRQQPEIMQVIRGKIEKTFADVFRQHADGPIPSLQDELVLLDSGLDSLGFGILVARLEEELGYDPFSESDEPYYPRTFGDFVGFYERHAR